MAKITVPLAQVGLNQVQGARLSPVDNGGEALARGVQQVGNMADKIFQQEQAEADKRVVLERTSAMRDKLNEAWTFIESNVQGSKVKDPEQYGGKPGQSVTDRFTEVADELRKEHSDGLTARQLAEFDQSVLPTMTALRSSVRQHEAKQWNVMDETEAKAAHMKNIALVAAAPTKENIDAGVAEAVRLAQLDAKRVGLDKTASEMHQLSSTSAVIAPAIERLMKKDSPAAEKLFQQYAPMMTPQAREKLEEDLETTTTANGARALANQAASQFGYDLVAARKWIEEKTGDNAKLRAKADAEYHDFVAVARTQERIGKEEALGDLYEQAIETRNSGKMMTTVQISELVGKSGLRGDDRVAAEKKIEYLFRGDPQERAEAKLAQREQQAVRMMEYLLNPDKLAKMTEKQAYALADQGAVGPEHALQLVRMKQQMNAQAGQLDVPAYLLNAVIKGTKMDPNKGSDAVLISAAKQSAADEILAEQANAKRPLDDEQKMRILKKHFRVEMVPGFLGDKKTVYGAADLGDVVKALPDATKQKVMQVAKLAGQTKMVNGVEQFVGTPAQFLAIRDDIESMTGKKKGK